jgi:hypothetical protein
MNNSKSDLSDPTNPDLIEYAKKRRYKSDERLQRKEQTTGPVAVGIDEIRIQAIE